jgi:hypothetical protein
MASKPHHDGLLEPFFADERTLVEKLQAEEREWRPHQPEHGCPELVAGLVLELGEYHSSYAGAEPAPTARLLARDGTVWSVVAFHGFLRWEIRRKRPRVGDFVAIAYRGTQKAKREGESDAYVYALEVERNPAAVTVETNARGNEQLAGSDVPPPLGEEVEHEPLPF